MISLNEDNILPEVDLSNSGLQGVNPAKQKRSREMEARLLAAGRVLLEKGSLDALGIDDVCALANCTVGAFYSRFESKEVFFAALQYVICRERDVAIHRVIEKIEGEGWPLEKACIALSDDLVGWYRVNFGILRASLLNVENGRNSWSPISQLGLEHKKIWLKLLSPRMAPSIGRGEQRKRILFSNQVVNGTLVHMLLNDPGPFRLSDKSTMKRLSALLITYLSPH